MNELSFPANYTIFRQGEEGRSLYIVVSGRVKVHIGNKQLAEVEQGKYFGEMAVFDTQPRSASATTLEPCEFLELTQEQLYDAIEETPDIAVNIIRELSRLIRRLNEDMNVTSLQS